MDCFTPAQTMQLIARIGEKKAKTRLDKLFVNSILAGPLLGFGCAIALSTNAAPWYQDNAPGLIRTIGAATFPIGLILVVLTGAELYTSTVMFIPVAFLQRRASMLDMFKTLFIAYFGNLGGMLFFCLVICGYGGIFDDGTYKEESIKFAVAKAVTPTWHGIFLKAIGANWLVCLAVFMAISAREIVSKIIAIWWPIFCFVGLGMDHVIANMFLIPIGIFNGAPFSVSYYIWKSMIPAWLGNTIGGMLFVGMTYWYVYMTGEETVSPDLDKASFPHRAGETATEQMAGPIQPSNESSQSGNEDFAAKHV